MPCINPLYCFILFRFVESVMSRCRTSPIWDYFTVSAADISSVSCTTCNATLSRGGTASSSFNTTNMRKHLKNNHVTKWTELMNSSVQVSKSTPTTGTSSSAGGLRQQLTLTASLDNKRPWEFDDVNSHRVHKLVGEMIAIDGQPFNIVNNEGKIILQ